MAVALVIALSGLGACTKDSAGPSGSDYVKWAIDSPSPSPGISPGMGVVSGSVHDEPACSFATPACAMPGLDVAAEITLAPESGQPITAKGTHQGFRLEAPAGHYTISLRVTDPQAGNTLCPDPMPIDVTEGEVLGVAANCVFS